MVKVVRGGPLQDSVVLRATALALAAALLALAGCGQDYLRDGQSLLAKGDHVGAVLQLKNAVDAAPDSLDARVALAQAFEASFDIESAEQQWRRAMERGGDHDVLVPRIVASQLDRGLLVNATREFGEKHLKSPAAESQLRSLMAIAYIGLGRQEQARAQLSQVRAEALLAKVANAQLLWAVGEQRAAIEGLRAVDLARETDAGGLRALARLYLAGGDRERSLAALQRSHELAPWHLGIAGEYAEMLVMSGQTEQARGIRDMLLKRSPKYYWTQFVHALVLAKDGQAQASHAASLRVLAAVPDHVSANLLAASAELEQGDLVMAETRLRKVLRQQPDSVLGLQLLSAVQLRLGQAQEARDTIRKGLIRVPDHPQFLSGLIEAELSLRNDKAAEQAIRHALDLQPSNASYLLLLSEIRARQKDGVAAAALMDQAIELGKDDPVIRDRVVSTALKMGDGERVDRLIAYALQQRPEDPQTYLLQAVVHGHRRDDTSARSALFKALDLEPGFAPAIKALLLLPEAAKPDDRTRERLDRAVASPKAGPAVYLAYAAWMRQHAVDEKQRHELLVKGSRAHPVDIRLRELLALSWIRRGEPDSALSSVQEAVAAAKNDAQPQELLARIYVLTGKRDLALSAYARLAAAYPQNAEWRLVLADLQRQQGSEVEAASTLRELIKDRPFDERAYLGLVALEIRERPQEALSVARELGQVQGRQELARVVEAEVLARMGRKEDAVKLLHAASKAGADPLASLRMADLFERDGQTDMFERVLVDLTRRFPADLQVTARAAHHWMAKGDSPRAERILQTALAASPGNAMLLNELAWLQLRRGDAAALGHASQAAALMPDNPNVLDTLGVAQAKAGQAALALETLEIAHRLGPDQAAIRLHLAQARNAVGKKGEAAALLSGINAAQLSKQERVELDQLKSAI